MAIHAVLRPLQRIPCALRALHPGLVLVVPLPLPIPAPALHLDQPHSLKLRFFRLIPGQRHALIQGLLVGAIVTSRWWHPDASAAVGATLGSVGPPVFGNSP